MYLLISKHPYIYIYIYIHLFFSSVDSTEFVVSVQFVDSIQFNDSIQYVGSVFNSTIQASGAPARRIRRSYRCGAARMMSGDLIDSD